MALFGLPLTVLGAVFATVAALTTLLYILKLRRRTVAVPFSPLWERLLRERDASRLFSQLKRWLSLALQLLLVALLVLALGDPRPSSSAGDAAEMVVLVDTSASMAATDVTPDRLSAAKDRLRELIRHRSKRDRLLIASMAASTVPLSPMTDDATTLLDAIDALAVQDTRLDLEAGLRFASDALSGRPERRILIATDGAFSDEVRAEAQSTGIALEWIPVGEKAGNVAVTAFAVRRYPLDASRHEVLLELTNTGAEPARVELTLEGDGNPLEVRELSLAPGERLPRFYQNISGGNRRLTARIAALGATENHLALDDRAYAALPERRRVRVLVVSPGNSYLEAALLLDEYLAVSSVTPGADLPAGDFDVSIFDGVAPPAEPRHGSLLYLAPKDGALPVPVVRPIADFGFDSWDKASPVLRYIAPENIQIARGFRLGPAVGDRVLGASELGPILVEGTRHGRRFIQTGFDPRDSDFVLRIAWPLFVLNVINYFVERDAGYIASFATGELWQIPVAASAESAELRSPDGSVAVVPVHDGKAVYSGTRAGFYELVAQGEKPEAAALFAANLNDAAESRIAPRTDLAAAPARVEPEPLASGWNKELWIYLVAAALVLSTLEWFTYHRRVTV